MGMNNPTILDEINQITQPTHPTIHTAANAAVNLLIITPPHQQIL